MFDRGKGGGWYLRLMATHLSISFKLRSYNPPLASLTVLKNQGGEPSIIASTLLGDRLPITLTSVQLRYSNPPLASLTVLKNQDGEPSIIAPTLLGGRLPITLPSV